MNTHEIQRDLEKAIVETFNDLRTLYKRSGVPTTRLVFPKYNNGNNKGKLRISEQEFRFVFVEKISKMLEDSDLYYSIETPTEKMYRFSKGGEKRKPVVCDSGESAAFDLTIKDCNGNNVALIEFKAHSADKHEIAKDFCKLLNKDEKAELRYFINLFTEVNKNTVKTLFEKMTTNKGEDVWLHRKEYLKGQCVNVIIGVLSDKVESQYKKYTVTIDGHKKNEVTIL